MATLLDTMTFPLHGNRLIEASAGTGKTYTITGLYLRLLLGHGTGFSKQGTAHKKPLSVDQILVVTFTEAATQELKDRIRVRIRDARKAFSTGKTNDHLLVSLLDKVDDHTLAVSRLRSAERQMDEAAIFTINGFCMRMLKQHAFESGSLFNVAMCEDDRELKLTAVKDYWRQQFYGLSDELVLMIKTCWKTPEALASEISGFLSEKPLAFYREDSVTDLASRHEENLDRIKGFKASVQNQLAELVESITNDVANKHLDGRSFSKGNVPKWANAIALWAEQPTETYLIPKELIHFGIDKIETKAKGELTIDLGLPRSIQDFVDHPPELKSVLKQHAIRICREIFVRHKDQSKLLTFDDQITYMARALTHSETSEAFAEKLRQQFPVAMVDEFQDTDPSQYEIFNRLYSNQPECGLFMIGDPKQAIYAFRGGDIFTYIRARRRVDEHYSLGTNWRSSSAMVESVNVLFESAVEPFIYDEDIPFESVAANDSSSNMGWKIAGVDQPAMTLWQPDPSELISKDSKFLDIMTDATANEIARLLNLGDEEHLHLYKSSIHRKLEPGRIAVLVRSYKQAQRIKEALSERGVASVYSSDRNSVFEQPEAIVILRLLKAFQSPENERLIKSALGSYLFDWNAVELDRLNEDENHWEEIVEQFKHYSYLWLSQGVLPALRCLMLDYNLATKLRSNIYGERNLTDFLHLCELLQNQSKTVESRYALISWLEERINQPNQSAKEQQLRLESEQNLVKIVTYHKSKGLEYDVVFAPFVSYYWPSKIKGITVSHNQDGDALVDVSGDATDEAERERIAEDVRLLYVTLTRSVYACYLGMPGNMPGTKSKPDPKPCPKYFSDTGLGRLINQGVAIDSDTLMNKISLWSDMCSHLEVKTPPSETKVIYEPREHVAIDLESSKFKGDIDHNWWVTSYSRLASDHTNYDASGEIKGYEDPRDAVDLDSEDTFSIHSFPKGADPGTFLHTLFETIQYEDCENSETKDIIKQLLLNSDISSSLIKASLPSYLLARKSHDEVVLEKNKVIDQWVNVLHNMVCNVLTTSLEQGAFKASLSSPQAAPVLSRTSNDQRLVELEFLIPIQGIITCEQVNQIIKQDPLTSQTDHKLSFDNVQGMLKGFIDLTFELDGRYYVLDWKSNFLGTDSSAYTQSAMATAMLDHRYDFQYQLYTLALHRFLRARLPDYDYDTHIGGAYYIFLRGVQNHTNNGVFFTKPSKKLIEQLDDLFSNTEHTIKESRGNASEADELNIPSGEQGELF